MATPEQYIEWEEEGSVEGEVEYSDDSFKADLASYHPENDKQYVLKYEYEDTEGGYIKVTPIGEVWNLAQRELFKNIKLKKVSDLISHDEVNFKLPGEVILKSWETRKKVDVEKGSKDSFHNTLSWKIGGIDVRTFYNWVPSSGGSGGG